MTWVVYCLVRGGGGCEIRTREGLPPTRFPTMLTSVHRRPPPSVACVNTIRAIAGEQCRTGMNETKTEPTTRIQGFVRWSAGRRLPVGVGPSRLLGASPDHLIHSKIPDVYTST
jgi:hypothetical protein